VSTCDYEYHDGILHFKCSELVHNHEVKHCIFHDINYLKGDNYQKHTVMDLVKATKTRLMRNENHLILPAADLLAMMAVEVR
jgi:hypothetical protein